MQPTAMGAGADAWASPSTTTLPGLDEAVGPLVRPVTAIPAGRTLSEELDRRFKAEPELECLVLLARGRPSHLVTREHYYLKTGGPFGFTLFQKKPAEAVGKESPLVVPATTTVRALAHMALERPRDSQYDPVVVVDEQQRLLGVVTIRQLLQRSSELDLHAARMAHPLTLLPSGNLIPSAITSALMEEHDEGITVVFSSLDELDSYNESMGFARGDELIRRAASVLAVTARDLGTDAFLGHVDADEIVLLARRPLPPDALRETCRRFDRERLEHFPGGDAERGFFEAVDAVGQTVRHPLITLQLGVVSSLTLGSERHPAAFTQRASRLRRPLRALSRSLGRSAYLTAGWNGPAGAGAFV